MRIMYFLLLTLIGVTHGQKPVVRAKVGGVVEMACRLPLPYAGASVPLHVVEWVRQGFDIPVLMKFGVYAPRVHPNYEGKSIFSPSEARLGSNLTVRVFHFSPLSDPSQRFGIICCPRLRFPDPKQFFPEALSINTVKPPFLQ